MRASLHLLARSPAAISNEKTRDLVLAVMRTTATKREARQYVSKYGLPGPAKFDSVSASAANTKFRVSVIRLTTDIENAPALSKTLSLLMDLGANPIVVLDAGKEIQAYKDGNESFTTYIQTLYNRALQWADAIDKTQSKAVSLMSPFTVNSSHGVRAVLDQVTTSLEEGLIPILCPVGYDEDMAEARFVNANRAVKAVVEEIELSQSHKVDKVVFVDPLGGIPSAHRQAAHVLVNMKQEYGEISAELMNSKELTAKTKMTHLENLNSMNDIFATLKDASTTTGIITTPKSAGAVLDRNPVLYNLLTDRPLISPSLPIKLGRTQQVTSVLRSGFPVRVIYSKDGFDISKEAKAGNLNIAKLVELINRSFQKKLDLDHYLKRIGSQTAALIIAGDYEGAAIITWEKSKSGRQIAYLDKFAVHPKSQGAAGVADIMLIHMVRRLFPKEVIWRSRANNPVNKWYFERSRGFLRIPGSSWVVFWNSSTDTPPLDEYIDICSNIEPSLF